MNLQDYHRLLKRQIKKANFTEDQIQDLKPLLFSIDQAYRGFDKDVKHVETILEKSSQELFVANKLLKKDVAAANAQLERVVNTVQEVIFQTDLEGKWVFLNQAWKTMTGFDPEKSIR